MVNEEQLHSLRKKWQAAGKSRGELRKQRRERRSQSMSHHEVMLPPIDGEDRGNAGDDLPSSAPHPETPSGDSSKRSLQDFPGNPVKNVLLMLSSDQPPHPKKEIEEHARISDDCGETYLITTRIITGLTPEESVVAFYGDADLGNVFLGIGCYQGYVEMNSPEWNERLQASELYQAHGYPKTAQGMIRMSGVRCARDGEGLAFLEGTITSRGTSNGKPLTLSNLPKSAARIQVYYHSEKHFGAAE